MLLVCNLVDALPAPSEFGMSGSDQGSFPFKGSFKAPFKGLGFRVEGFRV